MKKTPSPDQHPAVRLTPEERIYFQAVEAHFIRLRGAPLILSPRELERTAGWHREGIPLRVVCRGIDRYFEKRFKQMSSRQRAVSLEYCETFVRQVFEESRSLAVGGSPSSGLKAQGEGGELVLGLQRVLQGLEQALETLDDFSGGGLHGALERAVSLAQDLLQRARDDDPANRALTMQQAETELELLNREVTAQLMLHASPAAIDEIRSACDAEMREIPVTMDSALYETTLERMTLRRLRQSCSIPDISLFAL